MRYRPLIEGLVLASGGAGAGYYATRNWKAALAAAGVGFGAAALRGVLTGKFRGQPPVRLSRPQLNAMYGGHLTTVENNARLIAADPERWTPWKSRERWKSRGRWKPSPGGAAFGTTFRREGPCPYPGWLGALVLHGTMTQNAMTHYMLAKAHYSFDCGFSDAASTNPDKVIREDYQVQDVWIKRYAEFPSPMIPFATAVGHGSVPPGWLAFYDWGYILGHKQRGIQDKWQSLNGKSIASFFYEAGKSLIEWDMERSNTGDVVAPWRFNRFHFGSSLFDAVMEGFDFGPNCELTEDQVREYQDADIWELSAEQVSQLRDCQSSRAVPRHKGEFVFHNEQHAKAVAEYYANCQWLVWAAEMWRIHSGLYDPPGWWIRHCLAWGIGCASRTRVNEMRTMNQQRYGVLEHPDTGERMPLTTTGVVVSDAGPMPTEWLLREIVERVPKPGAIPSGTELLAASDGSMRLGAWSGAAGPMRPMITWPKEWQNTIFARRQNSASKKSSGKALMIFTQASMAIGSSVAGFVTAACPPLGVGLQMAISIGMTFLMDIMEQTLKTGFYEIELTGGNFGALLRQIALRSTKAGLEALTNADIEQLDNVYENLDETWGYADDLISSLGEFEGVEGWINDRLNAAGVSRHGPIV